jgi:phosphotransferase system HPr (HPr) family protein
MIERTATIMNDQGIHCRPSAIIIKEAFKYPGTIEVRTTSGTASLGSILALMSLELQKGKSIQITVEGPDEERICQHFVELFETRFDFAPVTAPERDVSVRNLLADD